MTHEKLHITNILADLIYGLCFSTVMAEIWPEAVHAISTIITGVLLSVAVFFANRFLKKKFPEDFDNQDDIKITEL